MTTIHTISSGSIVTITANDADTQYVVPAGVELSPVNGYAIDATQEVDNRSFEINGTVNGVTEIGQYGQLHGSSQFNIGVTGILNTINQALEIYGDQIGVSNAGKINSGEGISAYGHHVTVTNTGTISSNYGALSAIGNHVSVVNSGDMEGKYGVYMTSLDAGHVVLRNTGTIVGTESAVTFGQGDDTFRNIGEVTGSVRLSNGNDHFEGKGGSVVGTIHGDDGNDVLRGGNGRETMSGDAGDDLLTGRGGADVFVFAKGFGSDRITDFAATGGKHDIVNLGVNEVSAFSEVKEHAHQIGTSVVLDFGHGDVLTLSHMDLHDLSKSDFIF